MGISANGKAKIPPSLKRRRPKKLLNWLSLKMVNPEEIQPRLKEFFANRPEALFAYLYGSYAKGTANKLSDVDVAVFLDENLVSKEKRFNARLEFIGEVMSVLHTDEAEVIVLNDAPPLLRFEVIRHGILLDSKDENKRVSFQVKTFNEYNDYSKILDTQYSYMKKRLECGLFGERLCKKTRSA